MARHHTYKEMRDIEKVRDLVQQNNGGTPRMNKAARRATVEAGLGIPSQITKKPRKRTGRALWLALCLLMLVAGFVAGGATVILLGRTNLPHWLFMSAQESARAMPIQNFNLPPRR